jgi:undecaprenyl diphosphate synthase
MIERNALVAPQTLPRHVAIIMDGNRRWAAERGLPASEGHRAGATALRKTVRAASAARVEVLTVFAFSEENWKREAGEVSAIMDLVRAFALREGTALLDEGVRVRTIGRPGELPPATRFALQALERTTAANDGLVLNLALNYGARTELADAVRALASDVADGVLSPEAIHDDSLSEYLYTAGLPDPDLLLRTGGELRVSNFLLYQIAYAELWSTPVHWPDFDGELFARALRDYSARQRRFGS